MEVNCYEISQTMTLGELKRQISKDYYIPSEKQNISINGQKCDGDDKKLLKDLGVKLENGVKINVQTASDKIKIPNGQKKEDSESDDESQNEKVGSNEKEMKTEKPLIIEEKGWECPLCTLINLPSRQQCLACSTQRPTANKISKLKEIEYHLKVNEDLRTFFKMDKIDLRPKNSERNDLNRQSVNRKSSDLLNILVEDKNVFKKEALPQKNVIAVTTTSTVTIANPNITRNKYRGVDNFNPYKAYLFPKTTASTEIRKPIITNVIYKSSQNVTKDSKSNTKKSHYQELVNLEIADIVTSLEAFECTICFMQIEPNDGVCLRDCLHTFCKSCLKSHINYYEEAEIKCPFINDMYSCQSFLQEREIRGLVSNDEYEKHLANSIRLAENRIENAYHCKTPNCSGWIIFDEDMNAFKCPVCTIQNCITCGVIFF